MFRSVKINKLMGIIVWDNGAGIDPDALYYDLKPALMEGDEEPVLK